MIEKLKNIFAKMKLFYKNIFGKYLVFAIGICLLVICSGCIKEANYSEVESKSYYVSKVIDGDTIQLSNGWRIRYLGIDTPEIRKKVMGEWVYDPQLFALEAKKYNSDLVSGRKVRLEFDVEKKDKYSRWLAYVYVDDVMVNAELLKEGLARVLIIPPNGKYADIFKNLRIKAQKSKIGIWSGS